MVASRRRCSSRRRAGGLAPRVTQQVQALVYSLNQQLQDAYIEANLDYVDLILRGRAAASSSGSEFERARPARDGASCSTSCRRARGSTGSASSSDIGAARARPDRRRAARDGEPDRARAGAGARPVVGALRAGAGVRARAHARRSSPSSSRAGALAAERDENVARAARARARPALGELVAAKVGARGGRRARARARRSRSPSASRSSSGRRGRRAVGARAAARGRARARRRVGRRARLRSSARSRARPARPRSSPCSSCCRSSSSASSRGRSRPWRAGSATRFRSRTRCGCSHRRSTTSSPGARSRVEAAWLVALGLGVCLHGGAPASRARRLVA